MILRGKAGFPALPLFCSSFKLFNALKKRSAIELPCHRERKRGDPPEKVRDI